MKNKERVTKMEDIEKYWIEQGKEKLSPDKHELWEKIVPIRLRDIYKGKELGATLDVIDSYKSGGAEAAQKELDNQEHSGMSYTLMRSMLKAFCDDGESLVSQLK